MSEQKTDISSNRNSTKLKSYKILKGVRLVKPESVTRASRGKTGTGTSSKSKFTTSPSTTSSDSDSDSSSGSDSPSSPSTSPSSSSKFFSQPWSRSSLTSGYSKTSRTSTESSTSSKPTMSTPSYWKSSGTSTSSRSSLSKVHKSPSATKWQSESSPTSTSSTSSSTSKSSNLSSMSRFKGSKGRQWTPTPSEIRRIKQAMRLEYDDTDETQRDESPVFNREFEESTGESASAKAPKESVTSSQLQVHPQMDLIKRTSLPSYWRDFAEGGHHNGRRAYGKTSLHNIRYPKSDIQEVLCANGSRQGKGLSEGSRTYQSRSTNKHSDRSDRNMRSTPSDKFNQRSSQHSVASANSFTEEAKLPKEDRSITIRLNININANDLMGLSFSQNGYQPETVIDKHIYVDGREVSQGDICVK